MYGLLRNESSFIYIAKSEGVNMRLMISSFM